MVACGRKLYLVLVVVVVSPLQMTLKGCSLIKVNNSSCMAEAFEMETTAPTRLSRTLYWGAIQKRIFLSLVECKVYEMSRVSVT